MSIILEDFKIEKPKVKTDGYIQTYPDESLPPNWSKDEHRKYLYKKKLNLITEWHNEQNQLTHYTERFEPDETKDGKKAIKPWTYHTKITEGETVGIWKQVKWQGEQCFWGSHFIKECEKPLLVVEGEKCLHFVNNHKFLKEHYFATTWYGGTNNIYDFNFEIFKDKEVILCPDNDEAGNLAMHTIAYNLLVKGITTKIKLFNLAEKFKNDYPSGWDLADGFASNHKLEDVLKPDSIFINDYSRTTHKEILKEVKETLEKRAEKKTAKKIKDQYAYVMSNDMFNRVGTKDFLTATQINNYHRHQFKHETLSATLLKDPDFNKSITFMTNAKYPPGITVIQKEGEIPFIGTGKVLNIYKPNYIQPKKGDVKWLLNHFTFLMGEKKFSIVEQFLAYLVQCPGEKPKWALVMVSEIEGVGKGLWARICSRVLGEDNVNENANYKHLTNTHNSLLVGTQLIVLNEISLGDFKSKAEGTNTLKNYVADDTYTANFKNKPMVTLPNLTAFTLFSNDVRVIGANAGVRRYFFINIKTTEQEIIRITDEGFFDKAFNFVESDEGAAALLHYFKYEVRIDKPEIFKRRAPQTDDLLELIEQSKHPVQKKLEHELKFGHKIFGKRKYAGFMSFAELNEALSTRDRDPTEQFDWGSYGDDALFKFLEQNCIPWNNGEKTRQIEIKPPHKERFYLLQDNGPIPGKSLKDYTPKELIKLRSHYSNIEKAIETEAERVERARYQLELNKDNKDLQERLKKIIGRGIRTPQQIFNEYDEQTFAAEQKDMSIAYHDQGMGAPPF